MFSLSKTKDLAKTRESGRANQPIWPTGLLWVAKRAYRKEEQRVSRFWTVESLNPCFPYVKRRNERNLTSPVGTFSGLLCSVVHWAEFSKTKSQKFHEAYSRLPIEVCNSRHSAVDFGRRLHQKSRFSLARGPATAPSARGLSPQNH